MDTVGVNKFYNVLISKKVLFDFVFDVLAAKYNGHYLEQNMSNFSISPEDFENLIRYIRQKKIQIDIPQLNAAKPVISNDLRVLLYKYHLGEAGYYKALNQNDSMIKQALISLQ